MSGYEYKVVPARENAFLRSLFWTDDAAMTLAEAINTFAREGWTFVRTDRMPAARRRLLGFSATRDVMVFQRPRLRQPSQAFGIGRAPAENPSAFARDVAALLDDVCPLPLARAA